MTNIRSGLLCAIAVSGLCFPAHAAKFTTFDVPDSGSTVPTAISGGAITGSYAHIHYFRIHGFVRAADGSITTFDPPHSTQTYPTSINRVGTIVGYYIHSSGVEHESTPTSDACRDFDGGCAFIRSADGTITEFTPPGAQRTTSISINDSGTIGGSYLDSGYQSHGFIRAPDGTITTFDAEGSIIGVGSINLGGVITGSYNDSNGTHGFLRAADGSITTFDPRHSTQTYPNSINKAGTIVGDYIDRSGVFHGFARTADGTITTIDPSRSIGTFGGSIARWGTITGYYADGSSGKQGFIRESNGKISSFHVPGARQTFAIHIDSVGTDRNAITGYYEDSTGHLHGFLRTP